MQPHHQFFNSLKHLEKRLKLENHPSPPPTVSPPPSPPPPPPPPPAAKHQEITNNTQQADSLGTPIYLNFNPSIATNTTNSSNVPESEAPQEFLSESSDFPPTHHSSPHENQAEARETVYQAERSSLDDDIELLMQLLRLSELNETEEGIIDVGCDDGFYGKIVGVKGPKSLKEVERLEGWVKHFLKGEMKEPLRLAHLILGKAAFVHSGDDCDGFGGFVFPSTIDEFLQNDPPVD